MKLRNQLMYEMAEGISRRVDVLTDDNMRKCTILLE